MCLICLLFPDIVRCAEACKGVQYAILVGGFPRKEGMTRRDLLERNSSVLVVLCITAPKHRVFLCHL